MISLQIELLGGFKTRLASGAPLVFSQRKAEAILAYLALAPDHAAPRTRLFNLLWSERGEEQARSSLRQALAALRKGLREAEPMPILSERGTVALIGEQVTVDAGKFEKLAQSDDFSDLQAAAALYQGDLLDDFAIAELPFQEWLDQERSRLRELALGVLQALATRHAEQNEFEAAIEMARRAAAFDPLRETAHRTLMRLFDASGQGGLALRQYESCRDLLQRELAVRPDAETESLYQEIKQKRGAMAASATAATAAKAAVAADMTLPEKPSIAVLPFKNMRVPEEEYFADGISDNILTALSKFHWFFVIARD
jgi:DNA-binding SARP family transcriptional activator